MMNMKSMITIFCITLFVCVGLSAQAKKTNFLDGPNAYLGQVPPGDVPVVFAPGIVSVAGKKEATCVFSPDGTLCLFHIADYPNSYTMFTEYKDGKWTEPKKASFSETRMTCEPFFSPDGNRIYFASSETKNSYGSWDLWYVERNGDTWSEPVNLGATVNGQYDEFHPCIVADGSLYFSDFKGDINRCQWTDGKFQERVCLPEPINFKDKSKGISWGDPWVAADESIMIFKSIREGGYGLYDNYVSYKQAGGTWSVPKNLGEKINSKGMETAGDLSPDGKYLFFGRDGDIYWVKWSGAPSSM